MAEPALAHSVFDAESSADQENIGAAPFHDLPTRRSSPGSLRNARILGTDCARARCAIAPGSSLPDAEGPCACGTPGAGARGHGARPQSVPRIQSPIAKNLASFGRTQPPLTKEV